MVGEGLAQQLKLPDYERAVSHKPKTDGSLYLGATNPMAPESKEYEKFSTYFPGALNRDPQ